MSSSPETVGVFLIVVLNLHKPPVTWIYERDEYMNEYMKADYTESVLTDFTNFLKQNDKIVKRKWDRTG